MSQLVISMTIPVYWQHLVSAPGLIFRQWLPEGKEKGIRVIENQMELRLWFDSACLSKGVESVSQQSNVLVESIHVELIVDGVSDVLAEYIKFGKLDPMCAIQSEYSQLGDRAFEFIIRKVNRLIAYAKSIKGQYWLLKYSFEFGNRQSFLYQCNATVRVDDCEHQRFAPFLSDRWNIFMSSPESYISNDDWDEVVAFVQGEKPPPLIAELVSASRQLADNDFTRSALTESITALEVALNRFAANASSSPTLNAKLRGDVSLDHLKSQIDHMGLSGSIHYLLPLIFDETVLPRKILSDVQTAVKQRQTVVHQGQREVRYVMKYISAIERLCGILNDLSK